MILLNAFHLSSFKLLPEKEENEEKKPIIDGLIKFEVYPLNKHGFILYFTYTMFMLSGYDF